MPAPYVPGKPNPYFPVHKYHCVPIDRNIKPIEECRVHHYVGSTNQLAKGIAVHLLTPEHLWATFQNEAEELLKVDGKWIEDDKERNKRINAAYAKLWLADNRFQWAGLAAFASKQVGCGLLHSGDLIKKSRREREQIQRSFASAGVPGEYGTIMQMGTEAGAYKMYKRLGFGNKHLFLDIYPLHRFYMERGWKEFDAYLSKRQNRRYPVHWEIDRNVLAFGTPFREIRDGFGQIEANDLHEAVKLLARHEQVNILQRIMYNDGVMKGLLGLNQLAWATGFPTGDFTEIQLTLSAQCKPKTGVTSWFDKRSFAKLWVAAERMPFVLKAADQFNKLLNGPQRPVVEASIRVIAAGGGIS